MAAKKRTARPVDDLRPEYDLASLTGRVRGTYYERARAGTNLVLLEPEIAEAFPDSKAVNETLRVHLRAARSGRLGPQAHEGTKPLTTGRGTRTQKPRRVGAAVHCEGLLGECHFE